MFFSKPVLVKLIPQVQNNLTETETINKKPIQIKQMKKNNNTNAGLRQKAELYSA